MSLLRLVGLIDEYGVKIEKVLWDLLKDQGDVDQEE